MGSLEKLDSRGVEGGSSEGLIVVKLGGIEERLGEGKVERGKDEAPNYTSSQIFMKRPPHGAEEGFNTCWFVQEAKIHPFTMR